MWPTASIGAFQGNVGVPATWVESVVATRILGVVQERCSSAEVVRAGLTAPAGARYLIVAAIEHWNQMRTDDPIGAFIGPKNSIAVSVQLKRLEGHVVVNRFDFANRSHIIFNQDASRLLNKKFDAALRGLLWNGGSMINTPPPSR
jgi:hypothetical protein